VIELVSTQQAIIAGAAETKGKGVQSFSLVLASSLFITIYRAG